MKMNNTKMMRRSKSVDEMNVKSSTVKTNKHIVHPIEIGNGYGYFCNIDIDIVETHTNTSIHIDIHKETDENDKSKYDIHKIDVLCCCLPFALFGLSILFP